MAYAVQSIRRRPARSIVTAIGIGLATALVVMLLAVSSGVEASAQRLASASGIDLLATSANTSLENGAFPPIPAAHALPSSIRAADSNVATASPWLLTSLIFANQSLYSATNASDVPADWAPTGAGAVGWIPGENGRLNVPTVESGPGFSSPGDPHYSNGTYTGARTGEIVLDAGLASVLGVKVGDSVWLSPQAVAGPAQLSGWFANATQFRVVGLTGPFWLIPSALIGFVYLSELQTLLGEGSRSTDFASILLINLANPASPAQDQTLLAHSFPSLTFFTLSNLLSDVESTVNLYRTFGTLIGVVAIVVATLFTATVLLMSVDDRSRELALLRAIGYAPETIAAYVFEESLLLSSFGLIVGLAGGFLGAYTLNFALERMVAGLPSGFAFVQFDAGVIVNGVVVVLLIGLAAAILPAVRAIRLPVAQELRAP